VDLAGLDRQVDVVVGDEVTEALGDAAQFESQRNLPMSADVARGRRTAIATGPHGDDLTMGAGALSLAREAGQAWACP
jgi:hypothetical protein